MKMSCPGSCGLCPTLSPTTAPTAAPTYPKPTAAPTLPPKETAQQVMFFSSEIFTSDDSVLIDNWTIRRGLNSFFNQKLSGFKNHKIFTTMENLGIEQIEFNDVMLNGKYQGIRGEINIKEKMAFIVNN